MSILETLRRVNAPPPAEESVALRLAVLASVMTGVIALLREGVANPVLGPACLIGIPIAYAYSHWARHRDRFWLKMILALGALLALAGFFGGFARVLDGTTTDIQVPLAQLFLWVQLLHSFDVPSRRDLMFSLVSSFVLVAVAGVFSLSLAFGGYLALWGLCAVASLVLAHRSELADHPSLGLTERPRVNFFAVLRPVAATVLAIVVLAPLVFVVVPAAGAARALAFPIQLADAAAVPIAGGLANPSLGGDDPGRPAEFRSAILRTGRATFGYFGFSNALDTGVRGRPDDTLVMRVRAPRPDFWRGQTFDRWDGRQWTMSDTRTRAISGRPRHDLPPPPDDVVVPQGEEFVQTFYVERPGPNVVFGAYALSRVYFADRLIYQLPDGTVRSGVHLDDGAIYTVLSQRPHRTPAILRASGDASGAPERIRERYLQLPAVSDRVRALAAEITASAPATYDKVRALEGWMARNTKYSLDIPPLPRGADAVDQFLFVDRVGFCEQIGTSLVVMLRSLGIPARLVVGYLPGKRNPFTGLYEVRAHDAHAWAEVWFPGLGWQGFDPTAEVPLSGEIGAFAAGHGLLSYLSEHLPDVPASAAWGAVIGAGAVLVTIAGVRLASRRRSEPKPAWSQAALRRLEVTGSARGRPRRHNETAREYVVALHRAVIPDDRLPGVADTLELDAFSGRPVEVAERERVEAVLSEIAATYAPR